MLHFIISSVSCYKRTFQLSFRMLHSNMHTDILSLTFGADHLLR